MSNFDKTSSFNHNFAKSNPNFLKGMFGATDLMPLWIADMDFEVAPPIKEALQELVNRNRYAYEFHPENVFKAISNWNLKRHNLQLNSNAFIQVNGVLTGIAVLIKTLTKPGDGVMIHTPVYHQFFKVINACERTVVSSPLKIENQHYKMDFDSMESHLKSAKVKLILLCNPHNPVGRVWTSEEITQLVQLADKYHVTVISDEIHSDIVYKGAKFNSIAAIDKNKNHIAIIGSPAKTFGMQSIANGYLYCPNRSKFKQIRAEVTAMYLDHGTVLSANATIAAYTKGEDWLEELLIYLQQTLEWIEDFLKTELPQIKLLKPEGTYQIWLDFSALGFTDDELKHLIIHEAKLGLAYGDWFDPSYTQHMRMTFASPLAHIQKAFFQLKEAINSKSP
ncbi:MAG: aspartate aminotransferase [Bacteroidetes bacterium MedPE-SWsnd-G2]|nr:MAG: aspartate aminotransferase [Bacteroidetes bacterium MedPE-SWsnd-G2]